MQSYAIPEAKKTINSPFADLCQKMTEVIKPYEVTPDEVTSDEVTPALVNFSHALTILADQLLKTVGTQDKPLFYSILPGEFINEKKFVVFIFDDYSESAAQSIATLLKEKFPDSQAMHKTFAEFISWDPPSEDDEENMDPLYEVGKIDFLRKKLVDLLGDEEISEAMLARNNSKKFIFVSYQFVFDSIIPATYAFIQRYFSSTKSTTKEQLTKFFSKKELNYEKEGDFEQLFVTLIKDHLQGSKLIPEYLTLILPAVLHNFVLDYLNIRIYADQTVEKLLEYLPFLQYGKKRDEPYSFFLYYIHFFPATPLTKSELGILSDYFNSFCKQSSELENKNQVLIKANALTDSYFLADLTDTLYNHKKDFAMKAQEMQKRVELKKKLGELLVHNTCFAFQEEKTELSTAKDSPITKFTPAHNTFRFAIQELYLALGKRLLGAKEIKGYMESVLKEEKIFLQRLNAKPTNKLFDKTAQQAEIKAFQDASKELNEILNAIGILLPMPKENQCKKAP